MNRASMEAKLEELARPLVDAHRLELVDVEFKAQGRRTFVRVYLDKPEGGITLDEIESFSREFGTILEVEDPIPTAYTLEVSSPGLTRRLRKPREFRWARGRIARVISKRPIGGRTEFVGPIIEARDSSIVIEMKDERYEIPLEEIAKANLEYVEESAGED